MTEKNHDLSGHAITIIALLVDTETFLMGLNNSIT